MVREWWAHLLWIPAAAVLGLAITAVLSGWLRWPRGWIVLLYAVLAGSFVLGYLRWSSQDLGQLVARHWLWGLVGAIAVGAFVVRNVMSQPGSAAPRGPELVFNLIWLGLVYGTVDALLLSVIPIVAAWQGLSRLGWTAAWPGRIAVGAIAVCASLIVAATYHWGYVEFRGPSLRAPVLGNGIMSLGFVLTTNPLTAWVSHVAMHVASVLHGMDTTLQLPPHY